MREVVAWRLQSVRLQEDHVAKNKEGVLVGLKVVLMFGLDPHSACAKIQRAAKAISDLLGWEQW